MLDTLTIKTDERFFRNSEAFASEFSEYLSILSEYFEISEPFVSNFINYFATGNTSLCYYRFKPADNITVHLVLKKHFFLVCDKLRKRKNTQ